MANPWLVEIVDESAPCVTLPEYTHMPNEKQAMQQFEDIVRRANSVDEIDPEFVLCNGETIEKLAIYNLLRYRTKRLRNQRQAQAQAQSQTQEPVSRSHVINILDFYAGSSSSSSSCPSHPQDQASDP